ncbi:MAG TPA: hypothetical protein VIV55_00435 [Flavobacterium sp.]
MKSKNIDEYGNIIDIVFFDNHFIFLSDSFNSKTYREIIKTDFLDYKNSYNLLEKSKIFPLNFLQKINDSTLFINSFFDFTKEYFSMKGINVIFPIEIFKNQKYKSEQDEDFVFDFYWLNEEKFIALSTKDYFKKLKPNWFNNDYKFKIIIFNKDNMEIKNFPLIYREKQNWFDSLFNKNENLIPYIYKYKFYREYLAFICNDNLFVVNVKTTKICRFKLDSNFYDIQEINDKKEIIVTFQKNIIILKLDQEELIKVLDRNLKNIVKAAKLVDDRLIVVLSKSVKIYDKFDFTLIKQYGLAKIYLPRIIHTIDNKFVIIYKVYNKTLMRYQQKISFLET